MTYRQSDSSYKDGYSKPQSRLNQQIRCDSTDEGCPVMEKSGSVCGETENLGIFQEFRQLYDECLKNLEGSQDGSSTLRKLAPFKKLIDDLWAQNTMLVETVEELEQEATCRVTNLQDKLNKSCQKELHCMLKAKEREVENLTNKISEKDELLQKYCCQIEDLKKDLKNKCQKYRDILKQLKSVKESGRLCEKDPEENPCDSDDVGELLNVVVKNVEDQKKSVLFQLQNAESQVKTLAAENKICLKERNEIANQVQSLRLENEKLLKEKISKKKFDYEKEELLKTVDVLNSEKNELLEKVNILHENIQQLNKNLKETRWALTSEVAEKHDQIQDLKRCVATLEEQLRQADMQTHFKDDIIKELRKELKASRKSERLCLYDVVNELRERKNECMSNVKFTKSVHMNKNQSMVTCSGTEYYSDSSASEKQDANGDKIVTSESEKLLLQIGCFKNKSKMPIEELKDQKEFTRDLEETLVKTNADLRFLQNYECQEFQCKSDESSISDSNLSWHHAILLCAINKIEDMLRNSLKRHSCGIPGCKRLLEEEIEKICLVKNDLEKKNKSKNVEKLQQCSNVRCKCHSEPELQNNQCDLVHLDDIEKFREKSVTGVVALEQMKEQIDILENIIKKYISEFPCDCDKTIVEECEEKLEKLHAEFDEVTDQLCHMLQRFNKTSTRESYDSLSYEDTIGSRGGESLDCNTQTSVDELFRLKSELHRFQKQVCDQENAAEKLKRMSNQLEEEIKKKRNILFQHTKELDSKMCEISNLRDLIRKVCHRLKEIQNNPNTTLGEEVSSIPGRNTSTLSGLFCDLEEFWCILDKSITILCDDPKTLREDNIKLKEKLGFLEKCVCNKEETLRLLQDTVKLRECQIEELKSRMETSENHSSKLAQDVEEKCRLIANLQEAVRKCKQFEVNMELIESLRFEYCELECKLRKYEKEILLKDRKLESLQKEITSLYSKNFILTEKLKIMDPKLKILYKTCHLFEKMVNDLQEELTKRECEVESLHEKIKNLETELESEFKKCEERAAEDSKCIEDLSITVKNFQNQLYYAQENYNMAVTDTENRFKEQLQMRETELNNTICRLQNEIMQLQNQMKENSDGNENSVKVTEIDTLFKQAESTQKIYEKRVTELQANLELMAKEYEEERKNIMQSLCDEKKENLKNKNMITKLNENIKRITLHERTLKDCINHYLEEINNLKTENQELKAEIETRKKIMYSIERNEETNLSELEELIYSFKTQKAELKAKCCNLKADLDEEIKLKKLLECRVEDLNSLMETKTQEFNKMVENYRVTSSRIQQIHATMKGIEESLISSQNNIRDSLSNDAVSEYNCVNELLNIKTAENAKLICQIQVLKVEIESIQNENVIMQANKDAVISRLQHEIGYLENDLQELQIECQKLSEENKKLHDELEFWMEKENAMENEFRDRQKNLCGKLRATICEKNDLLNSLDELQKQLEQICLENVNKEKKNRELSEECSRLKINSDSNENYLRNKSDKIISNLSKEVKNLHQELSAVKENFNVLNEEYQAVLEQFKCSEKKRANLEKLYMEVSNENKELIEAKTQYEKELSEYKEQNLLLKSKLSNKGENFKNLDEKKKLCEKIKELTAKIKTLEKKIIPDLEQEISEKICWIENLKLELKEANISNQRMRNEAMRVIQHTRKYLAAQRFANDTLKTRLECSNKRGNLLGIENRELEEQLKAVTRMNEFLLCQLESTKNDIVEIEPRSFSPLPWSCSTVERDTSSSEYMAESGFQSMQPSPTNMDYGRETQYITKRSSSQWSNSKKYKCGGAVEYPSYQDGIR